MRQHLNEEGVIQFLLNLLLTGSGALTCQYCGISIPYCGLGENPGMGSSYPVYPWGNSPYVSEQYRDDLLAQFPQLGRM